MQTRFRNRTVSTEVRAKFELLISSIMEKLKLEVLNEVIMEELLVQGKQLQTVDTKLRRKPEDVTKEKIIEPLLEFLGYQSLGRSSLSNGNVDRKEADYHIEVFNNRILIEAETLNKDLFEIKDEGVSQVKSWLEKRSFKSDLGIATNGFHWVFIKYDSKTYDAKIVRDIDLRVFFSPADGQGLNHKEKKLSEFIDLSKHNILQTSEEFSKDVEEFKQSITKRFYEDYIKFAFGYDRKGRSHVECLITQIQAPQQSNENDKRIFAINLLSRLIFIKFLEDKRLIDPRFLSNLLRIYREKNFPRTFYELYLQPFFYEVLNKPVRDRGTHVISTEEFAKAPYLNGGLFREIVKDERLYNVENSILESIIRMLESYTFTLKNDPDSLNPDILGFVFEKTINYLAGEGNDLRKDRGAYYTPDDVTTYICKETIRNKVMEVVRTCLQKDQWKKSEITQYSSLEDLLEDPPRKPNTVVNILNMLKEITVLDPACGSGHFLTSALKELYQIHNSLLSSIGSEFSSYEIKKDIIMKNLFGVDIEKSAVEIARLRLWLSLIEDLSVDEANQELETLPNIEYNIDEGNGLLGYVSSPDYDQLSLDERVKISNIIKEMDKVKEEFRNNKIPNKISELKGRIESKYLLYNELLNNKLLTSFRSDYHLDITEERISKMNPFHWRIRFSEVFSKKGGFDVIIGNPPYVQGSKLEYPKVHLRTRNCGNTYAYFFEISTKLLNNGGYLGFIVPVSSISTERMLELHRVLRDSFSILKVSNFDDRPGKIFQGLEHCRSSIIIGRKNEHNERTSILSTKYNRWYSSERSKLFDRLNFIDVSDVALPGIIPKIGSVLELQLLLRLRAEPPLSKYLRKKAKKEIVKQENTVWYHNAIGYWIRAMNFIPKFKGKDKTSSPHLKTIIVDDKAKRDQVICLLNSSLFYWYFIVTSNGRDLQLEAINNFNINLDNMEDQYSGLLTLYCAGLMQDLENHSKTKVTKYKNTGSVEYQEFFPKYSKSIIDKIDDVLASHYKLSSQESQFIKTFDEQIRMSEKDTDVDEINETLT